MFIQKGGYRQEMKNNVLQRTKDTAYTLSVALGTAFAGIYGIFQMAIWVADNYDSYDICVYIKWLSVPIVLLLLAKLLVSNQQSHKKNPNNP